MVQKLLKPTLPTVPGPVAHFALLSLLPSLMISIPLLNSVHTVLSVTSRLLQAVSRAFEASEPPSGYAHILFHPRSVWTNTNRVDTSNGACMNSHMKVSPDIYHCSHQPLRSACVKQRVFPRNHHCRIHIPWIPVMTRFSVQDLIQRPR